MNYGVALNVEVPESSMTQNRQDQIQIAIFGDLGPKYFGQDCFENVTAQTAMTRKWRNFSRRNDIGGRPELSEKFDKQKKVFHTISVHLFSFGTDTLTLLLA